MRARSKRARVAAFFAISLLVAGTRASAHRIDEYLQATLLSLKADQVDASMRLIPGVTVASSVIAGIDTNQDGRFSDAEQRAYAEHVLADLSVRLDGAGVTPRLLSWSFPQPSSMREGLGEIHLEYAVNTPNGGPARSLILMNLHRHDGSVYLVNVLLPDDRSIRILAQERNPEQTFYELRYEQAGTGHPVRTAWSNLSAWVNRDRDQFSSLFWLGTRHIAEGTDHLLFLLTLLLPAPLMVCGGRWGRAAGVRQSLLRVLGIVTAFTAGHSITLMLAGLGAVHVASRAVEALIAASIFVSAINALRPILPGQEARLAAFFGLIHGLAFAATLDRLGLNLWDRFAGILAFNLGIEAMQLVVVAAILPSFILMSGSRLFTILRVGGAGFAGVASLGWMAERLFDLRIPVDDVVNALAQHSIRIALVLFLLSLGCRAFRSQQSLRLKANARKTNSASLSAR